MIQGAGFVILSNQKPAFGAPCNGCGYCCQNEACSLAVDRLGVRPSDPCPALEWNGSEYRCGMVTRPHHYIEGLAEKPWTDEVLVPIFSLMLGITLGVGCDAE